MSRLGLSQFSSSSHNWPTAHETLKNVAQRRENGIAEYQYPARLQANEIRLLQMHKGKGKDPIGCSLVKHTLREELEFAALSYVWGAPTKPYSLLCDGQSLKVTASLYKALWEIREYHEGSDFLLWADAICINQGDSEERTAQVRMMPRIYSTAQPVVAWLEIDMTEDASAIALYKRLEQTFHELLRQGVLSQHAQSQDFDLPKLGLPPESDESWYKLVLLLTKPWFSRVWIIQEYILSRKTLILSGKDIIEADLLFLTAWQADHFTVLQTLLASQTANNPSALTGVYNINSAKLFDLRRRLSRGEKQSLFELLDLAEDYQSTVPLDRIYALLGISQDLSEELIDYSRSVEDVLFDIAVLGLTGCGTHDQGSMVELLSYIEINKCYDLPSWVPIWTVSRTRYPLRHVFLADPAIRTYNIDLAISEDQKLILNGRMFDTIKEVIDSSRVIVPVNSSKELLLATCQVIVDWDIVCYNLATSLKTYPTGEPIKEVYWRTLIFNSNTDLERATSDYGESYDAWRRLFRLRPGSDVNEISQMQQTARRFNAVFQILVPGRDFCVTEAGYMGWAPRGAKTGDSLCILRGCRLPFVLRKCETGHQILGDSFVYGIMDNEPWQMENIKTQPIVLI